MLMDLDERAVDHDCSELQVLVEDLKNSVKHSAFDPAVESLIYRIPVPEHFGQVPPWSAGAGDPEDALKGEAVVLSGASRVLAFPWEQGLDLPPLPVGEHESHHWQSPSSGYRTRRLPRRQVSSSRWNNITREKRCESGSFWLRTFVLIRLLKRRSTHPESRSSSGVAWNSTSVAASSWTNSRIPYWVIRGAVIRRSFAGKGNPLNISGLIVDAG